MQTYIFEADNRSDDTIIVKGLDAHHIFKVMRMKEGDLIRLTDGTGISYTCEIAAAHSKSIICRIIKAVKNGGEPSLKITLAIGLSTGSKFDKVVEKGTEVGVVRFVPLLTEKGTARPGDAASQKRKISRWKRVAQSAVKQSGRSVIPDIATPREFDIFITEIDPDISMIFHPSDKDSIDRDYFRRLSGGGNELTVIIGPESGFSQAEIEKAVNRGIPVVSMGRRVLKTETAGIVLPAFAIYAFEVFNS